MQIIQLHIENKQIKIGRSKHLQSFYRAFIRNIHSENKLVCKQENNHILFIKFNGWNSIKTTKDINRSKLVIYIDTETKLG